MVEFIDLEALAGEHWIEKAKLTPGQKYESGDRIRCVVCEGIIAYDMKCASYRTVVRNIVFKQYICFACVERDYLYWKPRGRPYSVISDQYIKMKNSGQDWRDEYALQQELKARDVDSRAGEGEFGRGASGRGHPRPFTTQQEFDERERELERKVKLIPSQRDKNNS